MELTHVIEYRFHRTPDGAIWTDTSYEYDFWRRYLKIFDSVAIVSRVGDSELRPEWKRVDGPGVRVVPIQHYIGPAQYAMRAHKVHAEVQAAMNSRSAVVLRIPSQLGTSAAAALWQEQRPYAVHVVGDPSQAFAAGVTKHPLRPLFRWWFAHNQAQQCAKAAAALYVTPRLRFAYPPSAAEQVLDCSDVALDEAAFCAAPRVHAHANHRKLVTVATLSQIYKGIDVLLDALAICRKSGLSLDLTIVGSGKYEGVLKEQTRRLGLSDCVTFAGSVPSGAAVREHLDRADIFVLPSRTEGMPRALLEAMARGLPCIASHVGGIPDVLPERELVAPGDPLALAAQIGYVAALPNSMDHMSERNLRIAHRYCAEELYPLWDRFFAELQDRTRAYFRHRTTICPAAVGSIPAQRFPSQSHS